MTRALLTPLILVLSMLALPLGAAAQVEPGGTLRVTGEGEVAVAPDIARLSVGVVSQAPAAAEALSRNSAAMETVLARLREAGIAEADLRTSHVALIPLREETAGRPRDRRITGFEARNSLRVTVRRIDRLGGLLDAVLEAGANRIGGIGFDIADPGAARDRARRAAVADAMARAELYAGAAGVALGAVLSISEGGGAQPAPRPMAEQAVRAAPVAPGRQSVRARVTMVFAIE